MSNEIIVVSQEELHKIILKAVGEALAEKKDDSEPKLSQKQTLHSIKELADFLSCSMSKAQKLKNEGKIRFRQHGRKVIFFTAEILEDLRRKG